LTVTTDRRCSVAVVVGLVALSTSFFASAVSGIFVFVFVNRLIVGSDAADANTVTTGLVIEAGHAGTGIAITSTVFALTTELALLT
jgi:hypothetical protein